MRNSITVRILRISSIVAVLAIGTECWPDGAPCLRSVMETMNPLEAVEHQGGLMLDDPPFRIVPVQDCYTPGKAIQFVLEGTTERTKFKGFAIQPIVFQGTRAGQRSGSFVRMDDNGSWQFQCFRRRDSITHSHDEGKAKMKMWWRGDSNEDVVQFVATVVMSLRKFWVRSVLSKPLTPCSMRQDFSTWIRPPPTVPPPTGHFKLDSFQFFNGQSASILENSISNIGMSEPTKRRPIFKADLLLPPKQVATTTTTTPFPIITTTSKRLTHIIPLDTLEFNRRPETCRDIDTPQNCFGWIRLCTTSPYLQINCRRTCQLC